MIIDCDVCTIITCLPFDVISLPHVNYYCKFNNYLQVQLISKCPLMQLCMEGGGDSMPVPGGGGLERVCRGVCVSVNKIN